MVLEDTNGNSTWVGFTIYGKPKPMPQPALGHSLVYSPLKTTGGGGIL